MKEATLCEKLNAHQKTSINNFDNKYVFGYILVNPLSLPRSLFSRVMNKEEQGCHITTI